MISSSGLDPFQAANGAHTPSRSPPSSKTIKLIHTWIIDHFSFFCDQQMCLREYMDSSKFSPNKCNQGQLRFFLRLHPFGDQRLSRPEHEGGEELANHVSVYLHMESNRCTPVAVVTKLFIVKPPGELYQPRGNFILRCRI